jgi:hypothetical protein
MTSDGRITSRIVASFSLKKGYNSCLLGSRMLGEPSSLISRRFDQKHGDIHQTCTYAVANSFSTVSANVSTSRKVE